MGQPRLLPEPLSSWAGTDGGGGTGSSSVTGGGRSSDRLGDSALDGSPGSTGALAIEISLGGSGWVSGNGEELGPQVACGNLLLVWAHLQQMGPLVQRGGAVGLCVATTADRHSVGSCNSRALLFQLFPLASIWESLQSFEQKPSPPSQKPSYYNPMVGFGLAHNEGGAGPVLSRASCPSEARQDFC